MELMYVDSGSGNYSFIAPTLIDVARWSDADWDAWDSMSANDKCDFAYCYEIENPRISSPSEWHAAWGRAV